MYWMGLTTNYALQKNKSENLKTEKKEKKGYPKMKHSEKKGRKSMIREPQ